VSKVFTLINVGSFYAADTAGCTIEIVVNWLFPQWDKFYCPSTGYPYRPGSQNKCIGSYHCQKEFTLEILMPIMNGMGGRTPILNQNFYERQNATSALYFSFFPSKLRR
tara:strand:- start:330 stop:656 length:327 start_codon:yes stop_codon:yes gene_type:complete